MIRGAIPNTTARWRWSPQREKASAPGRSGGGRKDGMDIGGTSDSEEMVFKGRGPPP